MAKQDDIPDWFNQEQERAAEQAKTGATVNPKGKGAPKAKIERINKAFQVEKGRVGKWHLLVAQQKAAGKGQKTGPELIDEALDLLFDRYGLS